MSQSSFDAAWPRPSRQKANVDSAASRRWVSYVPGTACDVSHVLVRIGAVLRPEPDPEEQLSGIASDLEVEEFDDWMRDYRAGRWLLVCAQMFADVVSSDGVT